MDVLTTEQRRLNMSRIRGKDTKPEMLLRRGLHAAGLRFRLHGTKLPGKPDLVFPGRKKVIFVHGCFWHSHGGCHNARIPKSRSDFWMSKLESNKERDERNVHALMDEGWEVLVIWECELRDPELLNRIKDFLEHRTD